ncbi:MAG: signal peptidase I [Anaerolineae bacterium]|nr:signal peptidase I [Anaerolineae bacterium]
MDEWDVLPEMDLEYVSADVAPQQSQMGLWFKEIIQIILIVVVVRVGMDIVLPRYVVDGASMQPNFYTDERLIVDRVTLLFSGPSRGDVIVLDSPRSDDLLLKRVIGLPGETVTIEDGYVYIDGSLIEEDYIAEFCTYQSCNGTWELGNDEYFVLGDNRSHSLDSHSFGPVTCDAIQGIVRVRYWPPFEVDILSAPDYD